MNSFFREINRLTIMLGSKEETQHLTINSLEGIVNSDKIAQRFGHLNIVNVDKAIMHPVVGKSLTSLGL